MHRMRISGGSASESGSLSMYTGPQRGWPVAFRTVCGLLLATATFAHASAVQAFDGHRKGFVIGIGVGPGLTSYTQELKAELTSFSETIADESKTAVVTDFKLGGGVSDQFLLYYENRVSWFGTKDAAGTDFLVAHAIGLLGASLYLRPASPSPYVLMSVGTSAWVTIVESQTNSAVGPGMSAGVGYEFKRGWAAEATVNWGRPKDTTGGMDLTTTAVSGMLTVGYTGY
jgi:hypothetical protein